MDQDGDEEGKGAYCVRRPRAAEAVKMKRVLDCCLPLSYPMRFFHKICTHPKYITFIVEHTASQEVVGVLSAYIRPEDTIEEVFLRCDWSSPAPRQVLYFSTLGVLPAHRRRGLASLLTKAMVGSVVHEQEVPICAIYLHVLATNQDAMQFYQQLGFAPMVYLKAYYEQLRPGAAWVMVKYLHPDLQPTTLDTLPLITTINAVYKHLLSQLAPDAP